MIDQNDKRSIESADPDSTRAEILGALRSIFSPLFAGLTQMDLNGLPIEPIAIALSEDKTTMKTLKLILS